MRYILNIILAISFVLAQDAAEIKKQIEASGLSESQIRQMAKQRGMSDADIDAKAQEIKGETAAGEAAQPIIEDIPDAGGQDVSIELPESTVEETLQDGEQPQESIESVIEDVVEGDELDIVEGDELDVVEGDELDIVEDELILESQGQPGRQAVDYFGYNIFQRDPMAFQSSVFGAVDPDYNIGPGDEIIIMLWGETQFRQVLTVDREGFVFIPEVGQVFVNGLTMDLLESKMFKILSQRYSSLARSNGGNATTFLDISLGNMRPLRVIVLGEVAQPGAYQVSPSTTLFSALYYFNGPTTLGSLRDIKLIRSGKQIATIDFYDYLLSGKKINDVRLQLDDTIFLPTRGKSVSISGEINRPAIYELKKGEGLQDLMRMAGGLRVSAYLDRAQIDRIVPPEERDALGMDRMFIDVDLKQIMASKKGFALKDGDNIQIFSILNLRQNIVEINGAVVRPGRFDIGESLQLRDLVLKADSLVGDAYLDRVDVVRFNPDFTEKLLKLNLGLAMKGDPQHNIQLEPMDRVTVFSTSAMIPRRFVTISGHVKTPGDYLLMENMTLYDLIFIAGGITDEEWKKETFLGRADLIRLEEDNITRTIIPFNLGAILNNPEIPQNLKLLPGDDVRVYSQRVFNAEKPVTIEGVIKNPGQYSLKSGMNLKDLILEAGGLSESVYKYRIEVARIDPEKASAEKFAEKIVLEMDEQFSISNIENNNAANMEEIAAARGGFNLQPYDHIAIRPDPYFSMQRLMTVQGAVLYPGKYVILSNNETIASIVERAGGLRHNAYPEASLLVREGQNINLSIKKAIQQPRSKHNFKVLTGDIITINVYPNVVAVFGEVNNPGMFKYTAGMSMRDCISQAGGYTTDANKNDVWIRYPSGDGKEFKRYALFSPKVMDGSVITVARDESEEVDKTEVTKEIASILADFVQIALTLTLIANM